MCLLPDSASLSDSLSSSELELLDALAWVGAVWPSSSSSSVGPLGSGGCFSRSCRQIFSLLLIREIEVLRGRGQGRVEEQQQVTCKGEGELISEGAHSTCSRLERACDTSVGGTAGRLPVTACGALLLCHRLAEGIFHKKNQFLIFHTGRNLMQTFGDKTATSHTHTHTLKNHMCLKHKLHTKKI